jgi:hypothetical protein
MAGTICLRIVLMLLVSMSLLVAVIVAEDVRVKAKELGPSTLVIINSDSQTIEIGDLIHLNGIINQSLINGAPSDVVILISAPEGSLEDTFVLSAPDQHGKFEYSLPADVGGIWGFEALYSGIYSPKVEVKAVPSTEPGKTTLTLSGWPSYPRIGDEVTFKGRLTDSSGKGVPNRDIIYQFFSSPAGCVEGCNDSKKAEWIPAGTEHTDLIGGYRFSLPVVEEGGVTVRVLFDGDEQYSSSESREVGILAKIP